MDFWNLILVYDVRYLSFLSESHHLKIEWITKLDHFASKLTKITISMKIQTLIVNCTVDRFWLWRCQKKRYELRYDFLLQFWSKLSLMAERWNLGYEVIWTYNIEAICILKVPISTHFSDWHCNRLAGWKHLPTRFILP